MPINWFPGHMSTAKREIRSAMPDVDLVIEILDARIPFSSENPLVAALRGQKPCIQVLNKADLADGAITAEWLAAPRAPGLVMLAHAKGQPNLLRRVVELGHQLAGARPSRPMMAMILGIPNVGKSTVINTLAGRFIAKTGDKPAVTQMQQRVRINNELTLLDTPGFLWPKLSPEVCGYRLAVTGAISDRVVDAADLASFAARFLADSYPGSVARHYGLPDEALEPEALLEAIGRRRGYLTKGSVVDLQKASERLLHDLRGGSFGRISLERPRGPTEEALVSEPES